MSRKTVLILGGPQDEHSQHVYEQLHLRSVDVHYFDIRDFPQKIQISYNPIDGSGSLLLANGTRCPLDEIHSIYWRNYNRVQGSDLDNQDWSHITQNDSRSLAESIIMGLDTKWVNGWDGFKLHQRKPYALNLVARTGVRVPHTLCSNDPKLLKEFQVQHNNLIFKPIQGGVHTEKLDPNMLTDENLSSLALSPITFQEEIKGTNIRAFVAGDQVLGCEVRTNELDFRDDPRPEILPAELPDNIKEQSVKIARTLHLNWTGIDYRLTDDGEYVYLEANPSPMFMGFERHSGVPLSKALIDLLVS